MGDGFPGVADAASTPVPVVEHSEALREQLDCAGGVDSAAGDRGTLPRRRQQVVVAERLGDRDRFVGQFHRAAVVAAEADRRAREAQCLGEHVGVTVVAGNRDRFFAVATGVFGAVLHECSQSESEERRRTGSFAGGGGASDAVVEQRERLLVTVQEDRHVRRQRQGLGPPARRYRGPTASAEVSQSSPSRKRPTACQKRPNDSANRR